VLFNATFSPLTFASAELAGTFLELHPVQAISSDAAVRNARFDAVAGVFTIPAQTTAVFVERANTTPRSTCTTIQDELMHCAQER
jgi:hypothetical protein